MLGLVLEGDSDSDTEDEDEDGMRPPSSSSASHPLWETETKRFSYAELAKAIEVVNEICVTPSGKCRLFI